jgi:hypothetical protein
MRFTMRYSLIVLATIMVAPTNCLPANNAPSDIGRLEHHSNPITRTHHLTQPHSLPERQLVVPSITPKDSTSGVHTHLSKHTRRRNRTYGLRPRLTGATDPVSTHFPIDLVDEALDAESPSPTSLPEPTPPSEAPSSPSEPGSEMPPNQAHNGKQLGKGWYFVMGRLAAVGVFIFLWGCCFHGECKLWWAWQLSRTRTSRIPAARGDIPLGNLP